MAVVGAEGGDGEYTIYINKKPVRVTGSALSRDAILTAGGYNLVQYALFSVPGSIGQPGQAGAVEPGQAGAVEPGQAGAVEPGMIWRSLEITEGQTVDVYEGLHFNALLQDVPYG